MKYKQRGYMEDEPRGRRQPASRPQREGPRGRGLGAPTKTVFRCRDCGQQVLTLDDIVFAATCSKCGSDLHACVNCSQFDSAAPNECLQPIPERIVGKAKRNRCELFSAKITMERESDTSGPAPTAGKAAFDALFD